MKHLSLSAAVVGLLALHGSAETWTGFQNGGQLSLGDDALLRRQWAVDEGVAWEIELVGYGQSSPVIDGDVVYITSVSGSMKEHLHIQAIDRSNGKQLWRHDAENSSPEENTSYVSRAAPSPACDANGVIAFFEGGNVVALTKEGKVRWERDLVADYGAIQARHGLGSSLEQDQQQVFVWIERQQDPYVVALAKDTGETTWKTVGLGSTTWSSPRLVPVGDSHHLVISGVGKLVGIDPESGEHLWSFDRISGNSTPTPIPLGEGRFLIGATTARSGGANAKSNGVIAIKKTDSGAFEADYVWQANRATSSFGSPLAYQGHAYFVNRSGVVYCLDLQTGEEKYAERTDSSVWATPIGVGDHVYLFGQNGTTTIIQAGPQFKKVASNPLWKNDSPEPGESNGRPNFGRPVLYAVALVDGDLLMRRGDRLYNVKP